MEQVEQARNHIEAARGVKSEVPEARIKEQIELFRAHGYSDEVCPAAVWKLARYMAGNSKKGLLLAGGVGTGKTFFCQKFLKTRMLTANEIVKQYEIMSYNDAFREWFHRYYYANDIKKPPESCIIDDLGAEAVGRRYGDRREVLGDLIAECYVNWQKHGLKYYFTCNLTGQEVQERYGARIIDRLQHMCEVIKFESSGSARLQF